MKSDIQVPNFWRKNCDSLVSIVTRLQEKAKELMLDSRQGKEIFLSSKASRLALLTTHPPFQWVLEAKGPVCEADHRPPSIVEVGATLPFLHVLMALKETKLPLP